MRLLSLRDIALPLEDLFMTPPLEILSTNRELSCRRCVVWAPGCCLAFGNLVKTNRPRRACPSIENGLGLGMLSKHRDVV